MSKPIHIGQMIRKRIKEVGMTKSEFSRRIDTSPQNVYGIFKRESCDTLLLQKIGKVLNYDFFQHYNGQNLNGVTVTDLQKQVIELLASNKLLSEENSYLKEIVELYREKKK